MRLLATIRVERGRRYEVISCKEVNGLEEGLRRMLEEYCRMRTSRGVEALLFFIVRDGNSVVKVWSLEVHRSLRGPVIYLDSP
jgi:hypothetical protein